MSNSKKSKETNAVGRRPSQKIQLLLGDCVERMRLLEAGTVEIAVVCDPPY